MKEALSMLTFPLKIAQVYPLLPSSTLTQLQTSPCTWGQWL